MIPTPFQARHTKYTIPIAVVCVVALLFIAYWRSSSRAEPGALPPGAVGIASEYTGAYEKAVDDFKKGQKMMNDANAIVIRVRDLSLGKLGIAMEEFENYRLDEAKKAWIPLTDEDKEKAKRQKEIQERFNKELAGVR